MLADGDADGDGHGDADDDVYWDLNEGQKEAHMPELNCFHFLAMLTGGCG